MTKTLVAFVVPALPLVLERILGPAARQCFQSEAWLPLQNHTVSEDARKVWCTVLDEHEQFWAKVMGFQDDKIKHDPHMEKPQCTHVGLFDIKVRCRAFNKTLKGKRRNRRQMAPVLPT